MKRLAKERKEAERVNRILCELLKKGACKKFCVTAIF